MKIYQLFSKDDDSDGEKNPWRRTYDCAYGFVVCAESEEQARQLAASYCGDEKAEAWLDSGFSTCEEVNPLKPCIILRDFHAG